MIATLEGMVSEKLDSRVVIDVNGVGYGVLVTTEDRATIMIGEKTKLYVYEHIRENAHDLFGFLKTDTKYLFELLLSVNGVGPKMALKILEIGNPSEVRQAIADGNLKFIQSASGVGKRVAERVVVDLKDKVGLVIGDDTTSFLQISYNPKDEAIQALLALGFSPQDASGALTEVDPGLPLKERVTLALRDRRR